MSAVTERGRAVSGSSNYLTDEGRNVFVIGSGTTGFAVDGEMVFGLEAGTITISCGVGAVSVVGKAADVTTYPIVGCQVGAVTPVGKQATITMKAKPGAPTGVSAVATGPFSVDVAYTAPASDGGDTITEYVATSTPGGHTGSISKAGSGTISVDGLTTDQPYTFTVHATNSIGNSPESAASNEATPHVIGPDLLGALMLGGVMRGGVMFGGVMESMWP